MRLRGASGGVSSFRAALPTIPPRPTVRPVLLIDARLRALEAARFANTTDDELSVALAQLVAKANAGVPAAVKQLAALQQRSWHILQPFVVDTEKPPKNLLGGFSVFRRNPWFRVL
jgi:hypothetical protein